MRHVPIRQSVPKSSRMHLGVCFFTNARIFELELCMNTGTDCSRRDFLVTAGAAIGAAAVQRWTTLPAHAAPVTTPHSDIAALRRDIL